MLKTLVAAFAVVLAAPAFAAIEANKATQAELESINGIGPVVSASIVAERKKGDFKDWNDLFRRVQGVGDRSAAKFSAGGLTINGKPYGGAPYVEPKPSASATGASGATVATASGTGAAGSSKSTPPAKISAKKADKADAKAQKSAAASAPKK